MPGLRTEITEIATGLGTTGRTIDEAFSTQPFALRSVPGDVWNQVAQAYDAGVDTWLFDAAFRNGQALLDAHEGLRGRAPYRVEWKGPHRPPGDNVIPADLRIDHVYLVSCKYLSNILHNPGPARLFDRLLMGEQRSSEDWFHAVSPSEYQAFYVAARDHVALALPDDVRDLTRQQQRTLRDCLRERELPAELRDPWTRLCASVSAASARRWSVNLTTTATKLRLLWRLIRVADASYFVLGAAPGGSLRFRVMSAWDWMQVYELRAFDIAPSRAGQPQVAWSASVRRRDGDSESVVAGHVEIRWSHGRFNGMPEAKVYLDTPHAEVPGYLPLR